MACELALVPCFSGGAKRAPLVWQVLRTFRHVREELRSIGRANEPLAQLELAETARRLAIDTAMVRPIVDEWILRRPLRHVGRFRRGGLLTALAELARAGVRAGVFSDYPAAAKLEALGLGGTMAVQVCATDADVNAFKPHPRGFLTACERWGFSPAEVVYVGDRPDVDAAGAAAAGLPCVIIGPARAVRDGSRVSYTAVAGFRDLPQVIARLGVVHPDSAVPHAVGQS
jgi:FMN phosphatase YigB (HAD superfamily)